ncbi:MAG TPA: hypothetical protein VMG58_02105 [Candidatus Sulfotelmatobacter sp.]|nr:hypothetical protein [Candidatus Sulfotelmatobacter sp.]
MRILSLVLVVGMLSACAGGPASPSLDAEAKQFLAPADKACIYVVPSVSPVDISMDGRTIGKLDVQHYFRVEAAPGRHVLTVAGARGVPPHIIIVQPRDDVTVEAEAGRCYFLRTAWRFTPAEWQQYRVYWERLTEEDGQAAVNVLWLAQP